jgi:sugar/nucleoside kinase (ribokinase family)
VPVVADFGGVEGSRRDLLPFVDYLVANESCAERVAGGDDPERACELMQEMGPGVVVATLGERGCVYADESGPHAVPAFTVDVVDTTGAGDCFHGAFCVGVVRGWGLDRIVEFASAAAAIKCRKLGGRAGLPRMEEVEAFLREKTG